MSKTTHQTRTPKSTSRAAAVSQRQRLPVALEDKRVQSTPPIQRKANQTGLPDTLKNGMEALSGMTLDHVRVHYNSPKPQAIQAHAYAQGSHIHLASGQESHLPHELGHVVQQAEGRVKATSSAGGVPINDNQTLEQEATQMGEQAIKKSTPKEK